MAKTWGVNLTETAFEDSQLTAAAGLPPCGEPAESESRLTQSFNRLLFNF